MSKIFWSHKLGTMNIELENMPFNVTEHVYLDCQFGAHYYKERRSKGPLKLHFQGSQKRDVWYTSLKHITLFPEYAVPSYVAYDSSKQKLQKERESKMTQLKQDLATLKPV